MTENELETANLSTAKIYRNRIEIRNNLISIKCPNVIFTRKMKKSSVISGDSIINVRTFE